MTNPVRGEVSIESNGKTWTMVYTTNAQCELESIMGKSFNAIGREMAVENPAIAMIRTIFWVGVKQRHPDLTVNDAGDIIDGIGAHEAFNKIVSAIVLAFPKAEKNESTPAKTTEEKKT